MTVIAHPLPSAFPGVARTTILCAPLAALAAARSPNDRDLYLVECYGHRRAFTYFAERKPQDMTLKQTVADILSGELDDVASVFYFNPVEGWGCDRSEDVARAVADKAHSGDLPITRSVLEFIEQHVSMTYARGLQLTNGETV